MGERVVNHSAIPVRIKQKAVFGFMETQLGKMLFSAAISNAQPVSAMTPTTTAMAAARVVSFDATTVWRVRPVRMCEPLRVIQLIAHKLHTTESYFFAGAVYSFFIIFPEVRRERFQFPQDRPVSRR